MFAIQNLDWEKWFIRKYNSLWFFPFNFLYSCQIRLFLLDIMIFCLRDKTLVWENSCHFFKKIFRKDLFELYDWLWTFLIKWDILMDCLKYLINIEFRYPWYEIMPEVYFSRKFCHLMGLRIRMSWPTDKPSPPDQLPPTRPGQCAQPGRADTGENTAVRQSTPHFLVTYTYFHFQ